LIAPASEYERVRSVYAMACGLPVVATDAEGIREMLGNGDEAAGVVVPLNDAEPLGDAVTRLLDVRDWRRTLGGRARSRAESRFTLEATGRQLRAFLQVEP
jgi:glycosyltransferase involved in cell wall biosynthesis